MKLFDHKGRPMPRCVTFIHILGLINMFVGVSLLFLDINSATNKGAIMMIIAGFYDRLTVFEHALCIYEDDEKD